MGRPDRDRRRVGASVALVQIGERNKEWAPLRMIIEMQFVAMAFSCQLLPVTIDILFIRSGTRTGAVGGMLAGLIVVMLFTPAPGLLFGEGVGEPMEGAAILEEAL